MREIQGDLFEQQAEAIVIPTNTELVWRENGTVPISVMGAGVAKAAAERFAPGNTTNPLGRELGRRINLYGGEHIYAIQRCGLLWPYYVCLPTKRDWRKPSDLILIWDMVDELVQLTNTMGWQAVAMPRLGCGWGGLDWARVKPYLARTLDDRFIVVDLKGD